VVALVVVAAYMNGYSSRLQGNGSPKLCSSNQISFTNKLQVLLHIARGQLCGKIMVN
jgi:hypothetical protein